MQGHHRVVSTGIAKKDILEKDEKLHTICAGRKKIRAFWGNINGYGANLLRECSRLVTSYMCVYTHSHTLYVYIVCLWELLYLILRENWGPQGLAQVAKRWRLCDLGCRFKPTPCKAKPGI